MIVLIKCLDKDKTFYHFVYAAMLHQMSLLTTTQITILSKTGTK